MLSAIRRLFIVVLVAGAPVAHADLVVWEFANVTFDDGAEANGRFTVDTDLKLVTDFDILTEAGASLVSPFQYNGTTAQISDQAIETDIGDGYFLQLDSLAGMIPGRTQQLHLSFSGPLVPTGSASIVSDGTVGRVPYERQFGGEIAPQRLVEEAGTGTLSPVPEPAETICLALGLATMGVLSLRRRDAKLVHP